MTRMTGKRHKVFLAASVSSLGLLGGLGSSQAAVYTYVATLNPGQVVPPSSSSAGGSGIFTIDDVANTMNYTIYLSGLTSAETASHIHGFAPPGGAAGILQALPYGSPKVGTWNYSQPIEASILAGLTYADIHSMINPGGDIRGQIVAAPTSGCYLNCPGADGGLISGGGPYRDRSPDLNSDGVVSLSDFAAFAACFGMSSCTCVDYSCDGVVGLVDFAQFAQHFGHAIGTPLLGGGPGFCIP